jgi:hypothetical protein
MRTAQREQIMNRAIIFLVTAFFVSAFGYAQEKPDTPLQVPSEILSRRIGSWDTATTIKPGVWVPDGLHSKGVENIEWALGKRFIQGTHKRQPGDAESMFIETYDPRDSSFRAWHFSSDGNYPRNEMIGRCDEQTRTMNYKGTDPDGVTTLVVLRLADADRVSWDGTWRDKSGKVLMEMAGTSIRRK